MKVAEKSVEPVQWHRSGVFIVNFEQENAPWISYLCKSWKRIYPFFTSYIKTTSHSKQFFSY